MSTIKSLIIFYPYGIYSVAFLSGLVLLGNFYYVRKRQIKDKEILWLANVGLWIGLANIVYFILAICFIWKI